MEKFNYISFFVRFCMAVLVFHGHTVAYSQTNTIDSLERIIALDKNDTAEARALNLLAQEYRRTDIDKAKTCMLESAALSKALNDPIQLSNAYSLLTTTSMDAGHTDSALYYLSLLKQIMKDTSSDPEDKTSYNYYFTAGLFYCEQRNFKEALPYLIEALDISTRQSFKPGVARQSLNIGNIYGNLGDYKKALQYHLKALRGYEALGNKRGESFCYQNISLDFTALKQYDQALPYARKAMTLKKELKDKRGLATAFEGMAEIYQGLGEYAKALAGYKKALPLHRELNLMVEEAQCNYHIGWVYTLMKDTANAIPYFDLSRTLAEQAGNSTLLARVDAKLAVLQNDRVFPQQQPEEKLLKSLEIALEVGDKEMEMESYRFLRDHYLYKKQFEKALAYTDKYDQVKDSLQNADMQVQFKKLEAQYNLEKKEQQIALLRKDALLKQASLQRHKTFQYGAVLFVTLLLLTCWLVFNRYRIKQQLQVQNMRNEISRDLHDEVGGSISSIRMLSEMAISQQRNKRFPGEILQRISSITRDAVEKMSDIVWMIKPEDAGNQNLLQRMQRFLYEICTPNDIPYQLSADGLKSLEISMLQRKNLYLVFKEGVHNAIKHADTSSINVLIRTEDSWLHMYLQDEGKGFNRQSVMRGNGLGNMQTRAKELSGQLSIESRPDEGTTIKLSFPLAS